MNKLVVLKPHRTRGKEGEMPSSECGTKNQQQGAKGTVRVETVPLTMVTVETVPMIQESTTEVENHWACTSSQNKDCK